MNTNREIKTEVIELVNQSWRLDKNHLAALLHKLDDKTDSWRQNNYRYDYVFEIGLGWKLELAERFGGSEGAGEEHWVVIKLTSPEKQETYWKIPGWYQSYNGSELEFNNLYQVEIGEKVIKVWNKK